MPVTFARHANLVWYPALGRTACGELLRHDAPRDRAAGTGRGVLLHRELPLDDVGVRRRRAAAQHTRCGAGLSRVRPRPGQGGVLPSERCTGGVRADVAADHAHADGAAGAMPQLQGQAVHMGRIFGFMVEKNYESVQHRKFKYRVVFQGNQVIDQNWETRFSKI